MARPLPPAYGTNVCVEHAETGPAPVCPWPNCTNGTDESAIVVAFAHPRTGKTVDVTLHRIELCSATEDACFAWHTNALPIGATSLLHRVLWREIARRRWLPPHDTSPEQPRAQAIPSVNVYHYTHASAFVEIVTTGSLWLTDIAFLNDAAELQHGKSQVHQAFAAAALRHEGAQADLLHMYADRAAKIATGAYVASFSMDGDSLSQWRAYGPIAIGFSQDVGAFGSLDGIVSGPVLYQTAAQQKVGSLYANLVASAFDIDRRSFASSVDAVYDLTSRLLADVAVLMKHPAFADEREWRMAYLRDDFEQLPANDTSRPPSPHRPPVLFRTRDNVIIPYVTTASISTNPVSRLPIREVIIGPVPDAAVLQRGVALVLAQHGYNSVPVRLSSAPLRQ